ncbi:hypothetical protein AGR7A_pAt20081 [Agrobacterium deltaense NCPPB 1641]|uniref:Uncharacterized protein n=1 Tax=Agrobacterium deltaense NCPPB 1641 TaxID=1183425 RepID=A0A1S7U9I9_9HYPH|nr:hypothetical protein AGR7A_pAt20081 [Agrobacterium deltaense NCPPB 1641]
MLCRHEEDGEQPFFGPERSGIAERPPPAASGGADFLAPPFFLFFGGGDGAANGPVAYWSVLYRERIVTRMRGDRMRAPGAPLRA